MYLWFLQVCLESGVTDMLCCGKKKEVLGPATKGTKGRVNTLKERRVSDTKKLEFREPSKPRIKPTKSKVSDSQTQTSAHSTTSSAVSVVSKPPKRRGAFEMGIKNMEIIDDNTVIQTVEILKRPGQTLGFYIREGNGMDRHEGVFISRIAMGSVVENNGLLRVGDEILSVNNADVQKTGLDDVVVLMSIPSRLILRIRTSRNSAKNASCPSLSTLDQEAPPPVVVVKKCRSASVEPGCAEEIEDRYGHLRGHTRGEISVDAALQNVIKGAEGGFPLSPRPQRSRFAKDYVEVSMKTRDYSSDSEVGRSYYDREPTEKYALVTVPPSDRMIQRQLINDYEEHYGLTKKLQKLGSLDTALAYNSDSEVVYRSRHLSANFSDSETEADDERCNSLPRMDGGESSDEIRHWLRKFDTLSCDIDDDPAKMNHSGRVNPVPASLPMPTTTPPRSGKETYTSEEYSSWVHTKSPSFQRKLTATPEINISPQRPRITRQYSADASLPSRNDYVDTAYNAEVSREQHLANLQALSKQQAAKFSRALGLKSRIPDAEIQKNLPQYISRIRDLQLTRKPVQIRLDDYQSYRTERRTRRHPDEKVTGLDGLLSCHVLAGHGLKSSNTMLRDLYCIVEIDTINKARTMIRTGAINFDWDELFEIDLENARELTFLVYNWDPQTRHKLCFYGVVNLPTLTRTGHVNHKIALRLEPKGILYVDLQYYEPSVSLKRQPSITKNALFGVDLETIIRREKSGLRVPILVKKCIDEVDRRGLDVVGIYRLCGSAKRKLQLREEFVKNPRAVDLSTENVSDINVVTGILKDFLRELPEPLFTNALYQMLLDSITVRHSTDSSCHKLMMGLLDCLPKPNQDTMVLLMNHLKRVINKSEVNKMNSQNLAICFGPALLCPSPSSINDVAAAMDFRKHIDVLRYLLDIWPDLTREAHKIYLERSRSMERSSEKVTSPRGSGTSPWITDTSAHNRLYATHQELGIAATGDHESRQRSKATDAYAEVRPRVRSGEETDLAPTRPRGRSSDDYVEIRRFKNDSRNIRPESEQILKAGHQHSLSDMERHDVVELPPDPRRQQQLEQERMRRHEEEMDIRRHRIEEEARRQLAEHDARIMMEDEQRRHAERTESQRLQNEARRQADQMEIRREQTQLETKRLQAEAKRQAEQAEYRRVQAEQEMRRKAEMERQEMEKRRQQEQEIRRVQADNELKRQQIEQEKRIQAERQEERRQEERRKEEERRQTERRQEEHRQQNDQRQNEEKRRSREVDERHSSDVNRRSADCDVLRAEQAVRRELAEHIAKHKRQAPQAPPGRCEPEGQNGDRESPPKMDGRRSPGVGHLRPEPDGHHEDSKSPTTPNQNEEEPDQNTKQQNHKPAPPPTKPKPKNVHIHRENQDANRDNEEGDRPTQRSRQRKTPPPVPPKPSRSRSSSQTKS